MKLLEISTQVRQVIDLMNKTGAPESVPHAYVKLHAWGLINDDGSFNQDEAQNMDDTVDEFMGNTHALKYPSFSVSLYDAYLDQYAGADQDLNLALTQDEFMFTLFKQGNIESNGLPTDAGAAIYGGRDWTDYLPNETTQKKMTLAEFKLAMPVFRSYADFHFERTPEGTWSYDDEVVEDLMFRVLEGEVQSSIAGGQAAKVILWNLNHNKH